ncbi:MBG domain-containing protein [Mucilaginibacter terrae]|uniref:Gliding motility-associated-like protein n=1 Tax=Mucilaginibacter terrae TaxID=1955052 RepID=A0ABU3H1G6_9SPHI|nr:MBG domain-containing protein [Mucilaginibacter terrae]MDT3404765.1 gliding motility-associated-like protein [Mucilaginibacter terrae]
MVYTITRIKFRPLNLITGIAVLLLLTVNVYAKKNTLFYAKPGTNKATHIGAFLGTPIITFNASLSSRQYGSGDFTPATSNSNAALTFSSNNPAVATIVNNKVHVTGIGTATITASQPANSQYEAATSSATLTVIKASPVISFVSSFSPRTYSTTAFTPATANLKATVTFTSDNPAVATIVNNQVKMIGAGTANITATIADDDNYNGTTLTMALTVNKAEPAITFINNFSPRQYSTTDFTAANATLGATITYSSDNTAVTTVVSGKINMVGAGTANITATIAGDNRYEETTLTRQLLVEKATPAINFVSNFSPRIYNATDFTAATATLGAAVTFTSDNPAVATIVNNRVNMVGAGTTNITAIIAEDERYTGTTLTMPFTVLKAEPVVTLVSNISPRTYNTGDFVPATVTLGAPLVLSTDNPAVATIVSGKLNMVAPGTTNVTAAVMESDKYVGTSVTAPLTVLKASPTITFVSNFSPRAYNATAFTPATANFGANITFSSDNPAVATIVNNQVKMVNPGTANITATIADSEQYEGKIVTMPLVVEKVSASINFISGLNARPYSTIDFAPATATLGASITFTSDNPSVANIVNNQVHLVGIGTANITATIPDNARYVGKTATVAMTVVQSTPVITFATLNPRNFNTSDFIPATVSLGAPVTFTSDNPAVATIVNGRVNMLTVGTANITATVPGSDKFAAVTATTVLNVVKSTPVITFISTFSPRRYNSGNFTPASANYGAGIVYTSDNPAVAQIENNQVKLVSIGTANITASVTDNDVYNAVSLTRELTITQATQTITFAAIPNKTFNSPPFTLSATTTSGFPVTFTSSDENIVMISGNTAIITGIGTVSITASQAGNTNYGAAANVVRTLTISKVAQTINFAALTNKNYGDAPFVLTGNATSGLPITFVSSNPQVATISGNTVTIVGAGVVDITATQEGSASYDAATPVIRTFTVNKIDQTIAFAALSDQTYGIAPYTLTAIASSGLPVIFTSSDTTIAKINGNTITILSGGSVDITASQPGDNNYNAATSITQTLNIAKANQTISFAALPIKQYADPDFALTGTSTSALPLTYTSSNPAVATISGNIVTIVGVGNTTVTATQPGSNSYHPAASISRQLTVNKANQIITFSTLPAKAYADPDFTLTASASSGLPITYTSSNPLVATVTGSTVTVIGIGTTVITASQPGNENYNAATDAVQTLNVGKANQTITFAALPGKIYNDAPFNLTASATSGLPITFSSSNPLVATIVDNTVTIIGPGEAIITASQSGNANYNAAVSVPQTLNISQAGQTITFAPLPTKTYENLPFEVDASSTSGLPVTLTSANPAVATITNNTITIVGAGTVEITASQPGNTNYLAAASITRTLTVNKANQTIAFAALPTKSMGDAAFDLTATATSGLPISYNSSNPLVASISGSAVTINGAGATIITATQPGNANYNAAEAVLQILSVGKADQTIDFATLPDKMMGDVPFDLSATATSGLTVTYTSSNPAIASVSGNKVTINGAGVVIITASQSGNANFNAAQNSYQLLNVNKGNQTITFASIPDKQVGDPTFNADATASSGLSVQYSSSNNTVATVSATGVVTITGQGTVTITASQPGNNNWFAATPVAQTFTIAPAKLNQTITFAAIADKVVGDPDFNAGASAASGLPVSYVSSNDLVATISSTGLIHIVGEGTVTITASQSGNATYNAAPNVVRTFTVNPAPPVKLNQTITFAAIADKVVGDPDFNAGASAASGLPVSYVSSNELVATISSTGLIHIVGEGTVTITASQSGNATYNAAPNVVRTFTVNPAPPVKLNQTITFAAITDKVVGDPDFNAGASASSGLPVSYVSSNDLVATISSTGLIHIVGEGTVTITASQSGNATYNAAPNVARTFTVNPAPPVKLNQTITFAAIADKVVGEPDFNAGASASSGLPVSYVSSNDLVATVSSAGLIHIVGEGTVTITASQSGNATYNAAPNVARTFTVNPAPPVKLNQTITFAAIADKVVGNPDFNAGASASSGLPVSYVSSNDLVATVSAAGLIHIVGEGSVTITASQSGNSTYNAATPITRSFIVETTTLPNKNDQLIIFASISNKTLGDSPFTAPATATSGLPVILTSNNTAVATINGNFITIVGIGDVTITASQPGNATYNPAPEVLQSFTVVPATPTKFNQTITFATIPNKTVDDPDFTISASTNSSLPIVFTSSNTAVATVNGNTVHIVGQGNVTITASQAGDATYYPATATQSFVVSPASVPTKLNQTITFASIGSKTVGDAPFALSATASSTLPVTFSSSDPSIASVSGSTVTIIKAGNVTITASQIGDAIYNAATATQSFVISPASVPTKLDQTITFAAITNKTVGDVPFMLSATASSSLPVTFSSSDPSVASVSGNTVTIIKAGNVTITASQSGDATYNAATATQSFVISPASVPTKLEQTITLAAIPNKTVGDAPFALSATASSTLPVTFSSSDPSVASVSGSTVTIIKAGNVTITASQIGDAIYNAATATQSFVVNPTSVPTKLNQTITFASIGNKTVGDAPFALSAIASSSLPVIFSSSDPSIASVSGNTVTIIKAGNVTITASQAGDATYNPATATQSFVISPASVPTKLDQTITFAAITNKTVGDVPFMLSATASSSLPVTFSSSDPSVASVSGNTVTIIKAGNVTITASQSGDATYNAATATQSFVISPASVPTKLEQTITLAAIPNKTVGDAPFALSATASSSLPVTFSSSDPSVASVNGNTVTIIKAGNVTITASQGGDATYNAATATQSFVISPASVPGKLDQTITFAAIGNKTVGEVPFALSATATSSLPVTFSSSDPSVASISGNTVTIIKAGNVTITASQSGDATYNPATATQSFVVSPASVPTKIDQTITFATIGNKTVGDAPFVLSATASSTLPVTFSSSDPSVASISGNTVTIIKAGNVTITASQSGDATYNPATATQSFVVSPASVPTKLNQTITFAAIGKKTVGDVPFMLSATASSSLPVTFSSSDPSVASVSGNTVTIIKAGNVTITASQSGDATYNAATATQSFVISPASVPTKLEQTITLAAIPNKTVGDAPFALSATASSTLPVTFSSSDPSVASVSGSTVTIIKAGNVTITASQIGDAIYNAATATQSFVVNPTSVPTKLNQTITFASIGNKTVGDAPFALSAIASSSLPVIFSSSDPSIASVNGNTVTIIKAGNVTITASQSGDATYNPATATQSFVISPASVPGKLDQTITFAAIGNKTVGDAPFVLSATASSTLPVTFGSSDPSVASVNGNTVTIINAGNVTITASQGGDATYNPATATQSFVVSPASVPTKLNQTITFASIANKTVGDAPFALIATTSSSLPVTFSSSDPSVASISGNTVTIIKAGNVTITASQIGDATYNAATATQSFVVSPASVPTKLDQTITFASIGNKTVGDTPFALSAIASSSLPVTFSSSDPSVASISGNTVTIIKAGNVTITASQSGDATYNPATATQSFVVSPASVPTKIDQTITFATIGNKTVGDAPFVLSATASSTLPVTFSSSDPSVASISGNTVTIIKAGNVTITASQSGDATYNPATATQSFVVSPASVPTKLNQTITFAAIGKKTVGDVPFMLSATASSTLPVTFSSSDPSIASVNGNTVTIIKAGNVTITASQSGDATYNPATATQSFVISPASVPGKLDQTITFAAIGNKIVGDAPFTLSATASSTLPVTFSSSDPSIASVSGNTVTIIKAGNVTITASQSGDANYNAATATQSFVVSPASVPNKLNQTITFAAIGNKTVGDAPFALSAIASSSLAITFSSSDPSIASVNGNTVTIIKAGNVTITASQSGDATYNPATATQSFVISPASVPGKLDQTITFAAIGNKTVGDAPFVLSATASSTLPVTFGSSDPSVASVNGNTVTIINAGNVTITASQGGDATYNPATATQSFVVSPASVPTKLNQTITFASIANKTVGDAPFALIATTSSSLPVTFSSSDPSVASISGNTVTIIKAGNVTITASQIGDATYNAATATQSFVVSPASVPTKLDQTITFASIGNKTVGDTPFALSAIASSSLPVIFSSSDPSIASVSGNTVTIIKAGNVTITASQAGDATYNPATATQSFVISPASVPTKLDQTITFAAITNKTVGDVPFMLSATASSSLPVTFSSSDPSVASVSGNTVTIIKAGNVTITASQGGDATYNPATATQSFVISPASVPGKLDQTITFAAIGSKTAGDAPFALSATASSTLPVTFSSSDPSVASISGNTVTIIKAGNVTITASQGGDATYNPATATESFVVSPASVPGKLNQTITFAAIGSKTVGDAPFALSATASSTLPVTFSSSDPSVASVNGNTVTIIKAGNVTITASQLGDATYNPATATQSSVISPVSIPTKLDQIITFAAITNKTLGDVPFALIATATSSLPVTFSSSDPSVASVSGNTITIIKAGNITITASQIGDATYNAATATQSFVISPASVPTKQNQTITLVAIPNKTVGDPDFTVSASTNSGLPVTFSSSNVSVATVSGNTVHIVGPGNVTITASQAGDANYNPATATQSFVVIPISVPTKLDQTISFAAIPNKVVGDAPFALTATASSSLPIVFSSSDPRIASVSGNIVTIIKAGNVTITASQSGNANYNAATATQSLVVNTQTSGTKTNQSITFAAISDKLTTDAPFNAGATASSGLDIIYSSSSNNVATVSATGLITITGAGNVTITASQPGNAIFNPATAIDRSFTVSVPKLNQTIAFSTLTEKTYGNTSFQLAATASSGLAVTYTSSNTDVATISGNTVTVKAAGNVIITATQAGNATYNAAPVATQNLVINKATLLVQATDASRIYGTANPTFVMSYSGFVNGDTPTSLTVVPAVSTIATTTSLPGTYALVPSGGVSNNYAFTYTNGTFTITPASAIITFGNLPAKTYGDADFNPGATSTVNEPVQYTSSNTAVATIVNGNIHITGAGTAIITALYPSTSGYSLTQPQTQLLVVNKAQQNITFAAIPRIVKGETYSLQNVTASSGLPVSFTIADQNIVTLQGTTLTARQLGATTITANQAGNNNYLPAIAVTQAVEVINILGKPEIEIHKAVSPNGDGINDFLFIEGITKFPVHMVTVYNRNGVKVWETTHYDNTSTRFEGRSNVNGQLQAGGTYFYVVQFMSNGKGQRIEGAFVLKYQ